MKLKTSIIFLLILLAPIFAFNCGANDIKDIKINKVPQPGPKRILKTSSILYTPIKIKLD